MNSLAETQELKGVEQTKEKFSVDNKMKQGNTNVHTTYRDQLSVVTVLVEAGINIDSRASSEWTALTRAAYNGHLEVVKLLIKHDADINTKTTTGFSPLLAAAQNGWRDVVIELLEEGILI